MGTKGTVLMEHDTLGSSLRFWSRVSRSSLVCVVVDASLVDPERPTLAMCARACMKLPRNPGGTVRRLVAPRTAIRSIVCCEELEVSDEGSALIFFAAMSLG